MLYIRKFSWSGIKIFITIMFEQMKSYERGQKQTSSQPRQTCLFC